MKCTIKGCTGQYQDRRIIHAVKRGTEVLVFENVPAEVCDVCSDTLLGPETITHLEALIRRRAEPKKRVPLYSYV